MWMQLRIYYHFLFYSYLKENEAQQRLFSLKLTQFALAFYLTYGGTVT